MTTDLEITKTAARGDAAGGLESVAL